MQFYSFITETPDAPAWSDDTRCGTDTKSINKDLTIDGVVKLLKGRWPGKSFKVISFTNLYDERTYRLVHTHRE